MNTHSNKKQDNCENSLVNIQRSRHLYEYKIVKNKNSPIDNKLHNFGNQMKMFKNVGTHL